MTKLTFTLATCVAISAATGSFATDNLGFEPAEVLPSSGDQIEKYRDARDWVVYKNLSRGSCFIEKRDEVGGAVQMGLTLNQQYGYIGAFIKGAELGESGHKTVLSLNGNLYSGVSNNVTEVEGGFQGGYILVNNNDLAKDLEHAKELVAYPDAAYKVTLDVSHAGVAMYEARECMKTFE